MRKEMLKKVLFIFGMFLVLTTTYAYSALATSLAITSEVKMRPLSDIRVNGIVINSASGATMQYESEYSKNSISSGFILPSSSSSISYRVHIDNTGDVDYSIYSILSDTASTGLNVGISGYNLKDVIPAKSSLDLVVTYTTSNPSGSVINVTNTFNFKKVYYVTYETGTSQSIAQQIKYEGEALTLTSTQPTKSGYTFSKWNTKSDGTGVNYNSGASYTVDDDVTLYARYNITTYNITYNLDGGTNGNNPSTYTVTTPNITLADATKANYQFDGWTGNGTTTPTKNLVLPVGSTGDKTFTAHFSDVTGPEITVTNQDATKDYLNTTYTANTEWDTATRDLYFHINATDVGSGIKKIEYALTGSTTVPSTGWTEINNGAITITKTVGNYYLHVRATDNEDNVTIVTTKPITVRFRVAYYDDYSKSTSISSNQYYTGTALTSRTPSAVNGYTFDGWYSDTALTQKVVNAATGYTPTSSIKLYGKWNRNSYTVAYDTTYNGGTGSVVSQTVYYEGAIDLTPTATKSGWTFVGWNTDKDATTALSSLNMGIDDVTLYAIYRKEAITLTAHWDANGATLSSTTDSTCTLAAVYNNATQNTSCTVDAPTITRSGYTIIGFNTGYGDTTNSAAYNTSTKKLTLSSGNNNRTWYAITKSNSTLTASFAGYNGSAVSFDSASCYLYNGATSCTVDGPTVTPQSGFSFIGYNTTAGGTSTTGSYSTSTNKLTLSSSNDARTWYTVTKSSSQFTGTFTIQDSAAATKSGGTLSCYRYNGGNSCNITAPALTANSGYTAVGWNATADSQTASYASGGSISISSNKTFYSITYNNTAITITFNKNGATSQTPSGGAASTNTTITQSCYKYNGNASCSVTSPTINAATGYTALGYNTPSTATTSSWAQNTARAVSSNSTYYAISRANTYTIKYYQGNNSTTAGVTQLSGTTSVTYNTATNLQAYNGTAPSGWTFAGWTTTQNGTTVQYTNSQAIETPHLSSTDGATVNLYAIFKRSVKFVSGSAGATVSNLYEQRYNPYQTTGSITSVSAPLPTSISGWTTRGYRGATTAGGPAFTVTADGTNITPAYDYLNSNTTITLYGAYSKTLTVTYYGNNNTGGSTEAQTATRYYNSADTYSNPTVTISSNGFTRTNYTFTKWNTAADGTGTDKSGSVTLTANLNLYAQWRKNRIIFKFKALSGETLTSSTTSSDGNNTYTWTKDSSNIIYKAENGGTSSVYTNTYNFDAATINLANYNNTNYLKIVKTGYHGVTDAEWICDSGCTTSGKTFDQDEISMPSGVCNYANGDCTVYLKVNWTPNVCTITFDPNSGTFGTNNNNRVKTMNYGTTVDDFWNANGGTYSATRTGYHIDAATAWIKDGNTTYNETSSYTALQVCPSLGSGNQSVTLKANWKINVCTINYSPNGGTFTSNTSNTQMTCNYGNATCTSDMRNCDGGYYSATRTGYNIVSGKQWINGSTTYNQDNAYSTADFCPNIANGNQTVTLNVNWTPKKVTVTFKKNGATSGTDNQTQTFTYGTSGQSFSAKGLSRTGYAQTGWNTNSSGTGTHYNTLSGVSDAWIEQTSPSITLYAEWNQVPSTSATVDMTISSAISTASSASLILGHPGYDNDGSISKVLYWTTCTSGTATGSSSSPVTANVSSDKATLNITPCKGATLYYKVQDNKGTNSSQKSISDLGKWVLFAAVYNRVFNVTNASMDGNNLNAWVSASGTLRNNLLSLARDSTQGQNTYSQTDGTTYTKRLYAGILGRTAPSNTEVNNWSSYTNYNKVAAFLDSSEAAGIRTAWGY